VNTAVIVSGYLSAANTWSAIAVRMNIFVVDSFVTRSSIAKILPPVREKWYNLGGEKGDLRRPEPGKARALVASDEGGNPA
jgi:hypothetical protein